MKILVSNFGRQYSNALLIALEQKGWLCVFFTAFASNKMRWPWLPRPAHQALRKRSFAGVPANSIRHYPVLFILERLLRTRSPGLSRQLGDWFDLLVARRLKSVSPDLVITFENANRATMKMAKRLGIPTVLDLAQIHQDDIVEYGRWFMSGTQLTEEIQVVNTRKAEALLQTDYVLTLSSFAADSMLRHGWPADRLYTVNLGIDPLRFTPKKKYPASGPLRLLFVGTITRRKGLDILFTALQGLPEYAFSLTLIGPMADGSQLLEANAGRFEYLPFLHHEELVRYYQEADVFVFPSLLDSWAQTVLEAMACGTPAIVTENTGAKDAVGQGGGWIIPANEAAALESCLRSCLANREAVEKRGRLAHEIAQKYTWANYYRQVADVLGDIARRENISIHPIAPTC